MIKAAILSIGDELALGQTVDTNSAWLAAQLAQRGIMVDLQMTVADELEKIVAAFDYACKDADLVISTGGLGPTDDDLTRQALANLMGVKLVEDAVALSQILAFFERRNKVMADRNKVQALKPIGTSLLENERGTAPAIQAKWQETDIFCFAGVPSEMKWLFENYTLPTLPDQEGRVILTAKLNSFGMGESNIAQMLGDLCDRKRNPLIGTTVSKGYVSMRIRSEFPTVDEAQSKMNEAINDVYLTLGDLIFSRDEVEMAEVLGNMLISSNKTVTVAESCTSGLLGKMLTDMAGSSAYFQGGWLTYSNELKMQMLGVSGATLETHGAVSAETATEMAANAREKAGTDYALAISGIAGPGGWSDEKPVGLVYIALASADGVQVEKNNFTGDRAKVRDRSAKTAMNMLRLALLSRSRG